MWYLLISYTINKLKLTKQKLLRVMHAKLKFESNIASTVATYVGALKRLILHVVIFKRHEDVATFWI